MRSPIRRRGARSTEEGFTLLEVLITFVILAFGMLMLAMMQLYAMRQGSQGRHSGDAATMARSYLEQAQRQPWTVLTVAQVAGTWVAPAWAGVPATNVNVDLPNAGGTSVEHAYTVQWRVTDIGAAPICLRDVEIQVTWAEEGITANKQIVLGTRRFNQGDPNC